ncbi:DNA-binding transcriptional ArsR family regulator [Methanococcus maripaludis]|uniref:DNA-binding transcriptional ArsR family regulator n=1 Tax=Methanococcus maripaludis TaxID=39152 RepID=A0A7J9NI81_METMI|nr:metalloregulator ArsR/SmtB family transcription factor [Methanococcus maripaludis]MBA2840616.1 DNA-binding transcriptional ArsR family regulator [Methanococcus maripaludis]
MSDLCSEYSVRNEKVENILEKLPPNEDIVNISNIMNSFGDPNRLKILLALKESELCSCELSNIVDTSISAISHQLRILRDRKLVKFRKEGKFVYYELYDEKIRDFLEEIVELRK